MVEILFENNDIVCCVKPSGISSEEDLPKLLKKRLNCEIFTLHRLDNPVGGVMIYAKNKTSAAKFSKKIAENTDFTKSYLLVCEGTFDQEEGEMVDFLFKDSSKNKSFVVKKERKGVKKAVLYYKVLKTGEFKNKICSFVLVTLQTGRSHQIRVQFSSRKHPLAGDGKYGSKINCPIALFSHKIETDSKVFEAMPQAKDAWEIFT